MDCFKEELNPTYTELYIPAYWLQSHPNVFFLRFSPLRLFVCVYHLFYRLFDHLYRKKILREVFSRCVNCLCFERHCGRGCKILVRREHSCEHIVNRINIVNQVSPGVIETTSSNRDTVHLTHAREICVLSTLHCLPWPMGIKRLWPNNHVQSWQCGNWANVSAFCDNLPTPQAGDCKVSTHFSIQRLCEGMGRHC